MHTNPKNTYISRTLLSWWILFRLSNTGMPSFMSASKSLAISRTSWSWAGLLSFSLCSSKPLYFLNSSINLRGEQQEKCKLNSIPTLCRKRTKHTFPSLSALLFEESPHSNCRHQYRINYESTACGIIFK